MKQLGDVSAIKVLPKVDLIAAGFPCVDLSPAGAAAGIGGPQSGLVAEVFRLARRTLPEWILFENVPNMLVLRRGEAMRRIAHELEALGYRWAYRTVDSRFTGVPQRRLRVLVVASLTHRPEDVLLADDAGSPPDSERSDAFGFYWTEGRGGLGWARDAIPTLKGGSTIGIASPPAVWLPQQPRGLRLVMPSIAQGEELQGFTPGWTDAARLDGERDHRWKSIGNAVTVGVAEWVGERLALAGHFVPTEAEPIDRSASWPAAGWGGRDEAFAANVSAWPARLKYRHLADLLERPGAKPLSHRATAGFLSRVDRSTLKVDDAFVRDVEDHVRVTRPAIKRTAGPLAKNRSVTGRSRGESWASSPETRRRMQANRGRDNKPELQLRRHLHAIGLRYRLQARPEPSVRSRVDIVFRPSRVAVDVRGCFWHACPEHGTAPKANQDHWKKKLQRNVERDAEIEQSLRDRGWNVIVVWEHEDVVAAARRVERAVRSGRQR